MASNKNKTTATAASVDSYINAIEDAEKKQDCKDIITLISSATKLPATMWGTAIVGFGSYHYVYASGREGDAPLVAFAARKKEIVFYFCEEFENKQQLLQSLGSYKAGKGCIYIKSLKFIDKQILIQMVEQSIKKVKQLYP